MSESGSHATHSLVVEVTDTLSGIKREEWDKLALDGNPFVQFEFLSALEETGCIGKQTGWYPRYFLLKSVPPETATDSDSDSNSDTDSESETDADAILLGACPCYLKNHSYGEFVFDWAWADAYERHGQSYYPKLISAIPFTPATGPRLLLREDMDPDQPARLLVETILEYCRAEELSSMHWLFTLEKQHDLLLEHGFMSRLDCQYHWKNNDYQSFEDFLAQCNSKRRKTIRRERRYVTDANLRLERRLGETLSAHEWELVHKFYCSTFDRKWGNPSLTLPFFERIGRTFGDQCLIVFAYSDGEDPIAASIMFFGETTLYGRFWGASEDHHCLHFEACYYQGIEFCIERKLQIFEPGAQGEHKITRGFEPTLTRSAHWISNPGFREAVERYLTEERKLIEERREGLTEHLPFKVEL